MNSTDTKTVTLARGDAHLIVIVRQLPHDEQAVVGKKFRYGSGAKWLVLEVQ
jgi:hypothetical protein